LFSSTSIFLSCISNACLCSSTKLCICLFFF
jgi:hypothetical protein